jgi:drug/metabolite transporter superfamily protein YnfA
MAMHVIVKVDWISLGCYIHDVTLVWVKWHEPVLFPFYGSFEIFLDLEAIAGHILESVQHAKYLGVTISTDLKWNTHIQQTAAKAKDWLWSNIFCVGIAIFSFITLWNIMSLVLSRRSCRVCQFMVFNISDTLLLLWCLLHVYLQNKINRNHVFNHVFILINEKIKNKKIVKIQNYKKNCKNW